MTETCEPVHPVLSPRLSFLPVLAVVASGLGFGERVAHAAEPAPTAATSADTPGAAAASADSRASLAGFRVLASAGYGASTTKFRHLDLTPYATTFGLDVGYTFRVGLSVGGYFEYSLGGSKLQHRDPLIGRTVDFTADASSLHGGLTIGWDVPIYVLVLRYKLGFGISSMKWNFGSAPETVYHYESWSNPTTSFHFAPGLAVLYERALFEGGIGFDYFVQTSGTIPAGAVGKLLVGVKF